MKNSQIVLLFAVLLFAFFGLRFLFNTRHSWAPEPSVAKTNDLEAGAKLNTAGVGVAVADMNGDGHLDIVSADPGGVKYFENDGKGAYFDRGVIFQAGAWRNDAGVGVAVADLDSNGIPDMVVASPNGIKIFKNPIPKKK